MEIIDNRIMCRKNVINKLIALIVVVALSGIVIMLLNNICGSQNEEKWLISSDNIEKIDLSYFETFRHSGENHIITDKAKIREFIKVLNKKISPDEEFVESTEKLNLAISVSFYDVNNACIEIISINDNDLVMKNSNQRYLIDNKHVKDLVSYISSFGY